VSSGDNSNIVSARVAREHYHVPNVMARIYDPMRADIYERLNIPTVATTRWGVKQMLLMLTHTREEIKEALAGGDLFRMRIEVPKHLVGKPVSALNVEGKILVAGVDRGGTGFIPIPSSTFQEGDHAALIVQKDALGTLDDLLMPIGER
jgi:trk system potassium uptake protein TrkA